MYLVFLKGLLIQKYIKSCQDIELARRMQMEAKFNYSTSLFTTSQVFKKWNTLLSVLEAYVVEAMSTSYNCKFASIKKVRFYRLY